MANDRLEFPTQQQAQTAADEIHAKLIQVDKDYAKSVAAGHTTAWAIPYQLADSKVWCVNVKTRGAQGIKAGDETKLKPIIKGELIEPPKAVLEAVPK